MLSPYLGSDPYFVNSYRILKFRFEKSIAKMDGLLKFGFVYIIPLLSEFDFSIKVVYNGKCPHSIFTNKKYYADIGSKLSKNTTKTLVYNRYTYSTIQVKNKIRQIFP